MRLDEKIPGMTDADLKALYANATRLAESGTDKQQSEAGRLLPLIGAEVDARASAKAQALQEKRTTQRAAKTRAPRAKSKKTKVADETDAVEQL